jgi:glutathione synthase/RimK-type ligase-like ATP-grasp enzyme
VDVKTIGVLFGTEDTFPWALCHEVNELARRRSLPVRGEPVRIGHVSQEQAFAYDVVLDRISHDVPFYRTFLKCAASRGVQVVNDPFWWSADDRFFDEVVARAVGVAVPRTVLLPHKEHPPNTVDRTFRNLTLVDWDEVFRYLGFPVWLKPVRGGGRRDARRVHGREELFEAYDLTRDVAMMAQEAIEPAEHYLCWVVGRRKVRVVPYAPSEPPGARFAPGEGTPVPDELALRLTKDALALCEALGYDVNSVEFAVRDGVPYAIDFLNGAPDAELHSVGEESFRWIVTETAELLVERALHPRPWEPTGAWPVALGLAPR